MKTLISPEGTPAAVGPYSPALSVGEWIFLSGQGGFDPNTGKVISDDIAEQTAQTFRNIEVLLDAAGASLDDVVRTRIFVTDAGLIDDVGRAHGEAFARARPATTGIVAQLLDARWLVAIEAEAVILRP